MIPNLLFKKPQFHKGLNLTVRLGDKWHQGLQPGEGLKVVDTYDDTETQILLAEVLFTDFRPLNMIPFAWLKYEHAPNCRTSLGLYAEMCDVYGHMPITEKVTCIFFFSDADYPPAQTESDILTSALDRPAPVR